MKVVPNISFQPQNLDARIGLELLDLDELLRQRIMPRDHNPFQPHRVAFFAILFVEQGATRHQLDFSPVVVRAGECLLISKGQVHAFDHLPDYQGKLLIFTETFVNQFVPPACVDQVHKLFNHFIGNNHLSYAGVEKITGWIGRELTQPAECQPGVVGALLVMLLLKLSTQKGEQKSGGIESGAQQQFMQFRNLLEAHLDKSRDATFYAKALGMSYKQLNTMCKMAVNQTAKAFIHHYVILESRRRLVSTSASVKEISYQMGFDEPTNFVKYFKRQTGLTPRQFRSQTIL